MSNGDYNSVMQAGGWSNKKMLTRLYGKHSFMSNRERLADKMDDFLGDKTIDNEAQAPSGEVEQALQILLADLGCSTKIKKPKTQ